MQRVKEVGYASFNYCAPDVTAVSTRRDGAGSDGELEGAAWSPTVVRIHDGRGRPWSLERNGFRLVEAPIDADLDLYDDAAVTGRYYGMCEALVAEQCPGARVVKAFDHNVRCEEGKASGRKLKGGSNVQAPAGIVHGDYTAASAPRRLAQLSEAPKTNDALNKPPLDGVDATGRRFAFVNVWRPISEVRSTPLACCDAATVRDDDLLTFKIYYEDRVGENYFARHHEQHAWYYCGTHTYVFFRLYHTLFERLVRAKALSSSSAAVGQAHADSDHLLQVLSTPPVLASSPPSPGGSWAR